MQDLAKTLSATSYPGRGIILGRTEDGKKAFIAYFIMGRSENSRNRVFIGEGEGIRTQAYDPSKMKDPSLIIYAPVRVSGNCTIVTNGDQTDTIFDEISAAQKHDGAGGFDGSMQAFDRALRTREFEPDAPNYTPRISGLVHLADRELQYALSILKSADGDPDSCERATFAYAQPKAGRGHFIHTYQGDGNPLPSFAGEPEVVALGNDLQTLTDTIWNALDADNKVSLFTRTIDLADGETETKIVNANT